MRQLNTIARTVDQDTSLFDEPEFMSSPNGSDIDRLDFRHTGIIDWNLPYIKDKTILDLGYHNGRWSYAALKAGARHCTGIEISDLWKDSIGIFERKGLLTPEVHQGAIIDLIDEVREVETCLCLGFLYHTLHVVETLRKIAKKCDVMILDTLILPQAEKSLLLIRNEGGNAYLNNPSENKTMVPSRLGLEVILKEVGFKNVEFFNYVQPRDEYAKGRRITLRAFSV